MAVVDLNAYTVTMIYDAVNGHSMRKPAMLTLDKANYLLMHQVII